MTWCPWCNKDGDDGTENRICERHLTSMLDGAEQKVTKQILFCPPVNVCRSCGFANPSHARRAFKKVEL